MERAPERRCYNEESVRQAEAAEQPQPEQQPAPSPYAGVHTPAWLRDDAPAEDEQAENEPYAGRRRSAYDAYENPTFVRRGRSLKK